MPLLHTGVIYIIVVLWLSVLDPNLDAHHGQKILFLPTSCLDNHWRICNANHSWTPKVHIYLSVCLSIYLSIFNFCLSFFIFIFLSGHPLTPFRSYGRTSGIRRLGSFDWVCSSLQPRQA